MKRKTVLSTVAIVLVLLAVYGVWHYSPLRLLTQSKSQPDQVYSGTDNLAQRPLIVTKKITPEAAKGEQITEIPRPLAVLKDLSPQATSRPEPVSEKSVNEDHPGKKALEPHPDGALIAQKGEPDRVKPDASVKAKSDKPPVEPSKTEASHPYSLLLSSCRLPQSARKVVADYQKLGLTPYVVKVKFDNGDEWLRVMAGQYQSRQEALKVQRKQQLSTAIVQKTPYANLIGTFAAEKEMQAKVSRLKELGYSPYYLKTPEGRFKLLVGAFVTREGAEILSRELQSKGIQSSVINR